MTSRILSIVGRIAAVVGVVAASSFFAGTAGAHHSITFVECWQAEPAPSDELTPPPSAPSDGAPPANNRTPSPANCTPKSGETVWGSRNVRFTVKSENLRRIKTVAVYIRKDEAAVPDGNDGDPIFFEEYSSTACSGSNPPSNCAPAQRTYTIPWDSIEQTRNNGRYRIHIEATTYEFDESHHSVSADRVNLRVDNEPKALAPVSILAKTHTSVSVKWDKATEPDVLSYTLYRALTSDSAKRPSYAALRPVVTTQTTSYRDDDVKPAAYWYSVKVTRRSIVTPETGISSAFSPLSSAATVEPTPPPAPVSSASAAAARANSLRRFVPLTTLTAPQTSSRSASVPDAPYSAFLPYDKADTSDVGAIGGEAAEEGGADPRGFVLPVAVGAFLVSSAMALGRMPF